VDHRRLIAVAAALATIAVFSAPAAATGSFRSTTALHVAMSPDGRRLVLTATVTASFGTATGSVGFVDSNHHTLGTQALPECSTTCKVVQRVKVTSLARQVTAVFASYSGNATLKSSADVEPILYLRCRRQSCGATLSGAETSIGVTLAKGQTALATLGAQQLPCSIGAGQVANLATTGPDTPAIQIVLYEAGQAGAAYLRTDANTYNSTAGHSAYRCLVTSSAFTGFSPGPATGFSRSPTDFGHYGTTPRVSAGHYRGQYVGLLADCFRVATHAHTKTGACENLPKLAGPIPDEALVVLNGGRRVSHLAG
jgi:hypothetical protein